MLFVNSGSKRPIFRLVGKKLWPAQIAKKKVEKGFSSDF
jgi:hypothetical protein